MVEIYARRMVSAKKKIATLRAALKGKSGGVSVDVGTDPARGFSEEAMLIAHAINYLRFKKQVIVRNLEYLHVKDARAQADKWPIICEHLNELYFIEKELGSPASVLDELFSLIGEAEKCMQRDDTQYYEDVVSPLAGKFQSTLRAEALEFVPSPAFILKSAERQLWYDHYCRVMYPALDYEIYKTFV